MADDESDFISVVQAVKLIPNNFNGNPKQLREFCEGVESARQVVHPNKQPLFEVHRIQNHWGSQG